MDSHYPPVQRLMTPKPVSIAENPTDYFQPDLTTSSELRALIKEHKNHSVTMCLFSLVFEYRWKWTRINNVKHKHCTISVYQVDNAYTLWISDNYELVWVYNGWHLNQITNYRLLVSTSMYSWFRLNNFSRFVLCMYFVCIVGLLRINFRYHIFHLWMLWHSFSKSFLQYYHT